MSTLDPFYVIRTALVEFKFVCEYVSHFISFFLHFITVIFFPLTSGDILIMELRQS